MIAFAYWAWAAAPCQVARQTLRAAIDWSYDLLVDGERRLLERLSVFAGGWTLEAAESLCGFAELEASDIVVLLSRLVDQSLVVAEDDAQGARRYRLLETMRAYALERLRASGAESVVRARHLDWYTAFALHTDHVMRRAIDLPWLARTVAGMNVVREIDNLRAAWQWSIGGGDVEQGMRLAAGLLPFFYSIGYLGEGLDWLNGSLACGARLPPTIAYAHALSAAGKLAANRGDDAATLEYGSAYGALPEALHSPGAWPRRTTIRSTRASIARMSRPLRLLTSDRRKPRRCTSRACTRRARRTFNSPSRSRWTVWPRWPMPRVMSRLRARCTRRRWACFAPWAPCRRRRRR